MNSRPYFLARSDCRLEQSSLGFMGRYEEMTVVLGHDSALRGYIGPGTTWANEMNVHMNRAPGAGSASARKNVRKEVGLISSAPGAGSIARPVGQQIRALPLYHGCLLLL